MAIDDIARGMAGKALKESKGGGVSSVNGKTGIVVLNKGDIGLSNVDNTPDNLKPISEATQLALDNKANLVSGKVPYSELPVEREIYIGDIEPTELETKLWIDEDTVGLDLVTTEEFDTYVTNKLIKRYNNLEDLKADASLKIGDTVQTLGYYEINDGGGATYKIETLKLNVYQEKISDTLYATLITKEILNVLQFGAHGDGVTDDTVILQKVIDYAYNNKLQILIPNGTFLTKGLTLKSNITIKGDRINSILKLNTNDLSGLFNILNDTINVTIEGLHLIGDLSIELKNGIFINNDKLNEDTNHIIKDCYIEEFSGYGIEQLNFAHGIKINNCIIKNCNNGGIKYTSTDNWIENCIIYFNKANGIDIIDGSNNKVINSKTYGNSGHGLYIKGANTQIIGHETQDNYMSGIFVDSASGCLIDDLLTSANGAKFPDEPNIRLENVFHCSISGTSNMKKNQIEGFTQSLYSLKILNSSNNNINLKESSFSTSILPIYTDDFRLSNSIIINNVNYNIKNVVSEYPFLRSSTDPELTEVFTAKNVRPNSDGSTNYLSNIGLEVNFNNNITTDYTSAIDVERYDDIILGNTKSSSYSKINNFADYQDLIVIMYHDYFNDAGGNVGNPSFISGIDTVELTSTIPEGATKIRTKLSINPKKINLNNRCVITDIKVGFIQT